VLNLMLAAVIAYAGYRLHQEWLNTKAREAATLNVKVKPAPPPPFTPLPQSPAVIASGYSEIVQQTLFDRSRNPDVVVELPPPPPPKPMPPLPAFHGTLNLGTGPIAILSIPPGPEKAVEIGESIGQFKLLGVNTEEIAFEWDGKTVRKKLEEVAAAGPAAEPVSAAAPAGRTETVTPTAAPAAPPRASGPGADTGGGHKACVPNDSTPAGAVVGGYRKVVIPTPFGQSCRWDPVTQ
jgi:hypothetical protein